MTDPFRIPVRAVAVGGCDEPVPGGSPQPARVVFGGGHPPVLIAGPCSVENSETLLAIARAVRSAGARMLRGGAYKPRTRINSFQGLGAEALPYLRAAKEATGLPIVTEVLEIAQLESVAATADMIQIGARNMYNYPLLREAGRLGLPILLKRGFSATVDEWIASAEYVGHDRIVFCERGVRGFDPSTRNLLDLAAVPILQQRTGLPVIVDPSHATGRRDLVPIMARAALAAGADGLMIEAHTDPDSSVSDAGQTISIDVLRAIGDLLNRIDPASGS